MFFKLYDYTVTIDNSCFVIYLCVSINLIQMKSLKSQPIKIST